MRWLARQMAILDNIKKSCMFGREKKPAKALEVAPHLQRALFAAGCFWGPELTFSNLEGVVDTQVGYSGGDPGFENPTYHQICTGETGHAEVVQVVFDPKVIKFEELLDNFWKTIDPTALNYQGPDIGTQYRSAIYYFDEQQKEMAVASRARVQEQLGNHRKVVTEITMATEFYPAEEYHQNYLAKRGQKVCH